MKNVARAKGYFMSLFTYKRIFDMYIEFVPCSFGGMHVNSRRAHKTNKTGWKYKTVTLCCLLLYTLKLHLQYMINNLQTAGNVLPLLIDFSSKC